MKMRTLLAAPGLTPAVALAQGCNHEQQAQISCAEGQSWDVATRSCATVGSRPPPRALLKSALTGV